MARCAMCLQSDTSHIDPIATLRGKTGCISSGALLQRSFYSYAARSRLPCTRLATAQRTSEGLAIGKHILRQPLAKTILLMGSQNHSLRRGELALLLHKAAEVFAKGRSEQSCTTAIASP